ncbi:MAG: hypothetical protein ACE5LX_04205, partial [Nitrospinota bacterium]
EASRFLLLTGALSFLVLLSASCSKSPIEKALSGELNPADSNRAVNAYCQSCHVHAELNPDKHMASMLRLFRRTALAQAQECRECHIIKLEGIFSRADRHTLRPEAIGRGAPGRTRPRAVKPLPSAPKPPKKKRRWYFFYLF